MDLARFRELAGAWGAVRARWPQASQPLYDAFAHTEEGARILAEAARLDEFLDALGTRPVDPLRPARVLRAAHRADTRRRTVAWLSAGYAACTLLGFSLGFSQIAEPGEDTGWSDLFIGTMVIEDYL
jgi:hypothetical protein